MVENNKKKKTGLIIGGTIAGIAVLVCAAIVGIFLFVKGNDLAGNWKLTEEEMIDVELVIEKNNDIELQMSYSEDYRIVILNRLVPVKDRKDEYEFDPEIQKIETRFDSFDIMVETMGFSGDDVTNVDELKEQMKTDFKEYVEISNADLTDEDIDTLLLDIKEQDGELIWAFDAEALTKLDGLFSSMGIPSIDQFKDTLTSVSIRKVDEDTLEFDNGTSDVIEFEKVDKK